jgi:UDP-N-acetylmuramoyl-tripeptide--D-alanyl-D-alanine ligase
MKNIFKQILIQVLKAEAKLVLKKYKPKIVAITGSVGKTSTKDAVYAALSKFYFTRKSEKSFNSEIGLPLTILGVPNGWNNPLVWLKNIIEGLELIFTRHKYPEWLVLEVGADKPGDIKSVSKWLYADVVIITKIGKTPVHIEFFKTIEQLIEEKASLLRAAKKDGLVVLNADDAAVFELQGKTKNRVVSYGFNEDATLVASNPVILYKKDMPDGAAFKVNYGGNSLPVLIEGAFGANHIYAALAALSVSSGLGLDMIKSADAMKNYELPPGRMRLLEGVKNTWIIDDTYNSSPTAAEAALKTLEEVKTKGRKIAILGDMLELGRHTEEAHKEIGKLSAKICDIIVTVGVRARFIAEGALNQAFPEKNIFQFEDSRKAGKFIEQLSGAGDIILVKGSQGVRMERAVEEIMAHPENKTKLLVRQDAEWQYR